MRYFLLLIFSLILTASAQKSTYKFYLDSEIEMKILGKVQKLKTDTRVDYTWNVQPSKKDVTVNLMHVIVKTDGRETMNTLMDLDKIVNVINGKKDTVKASENLQTKRMLKDSFGAPLLTIHYNPAGKVTMREKSKNSGAKNFIEQGMAENTELFHPPYDKANNTWTHIGKFSVGSGGFAKGALTYTKNVTDPNLVLVKGDFTVKKHTLPTGVSITNGFYRISGKQHWDSKSETWTSGNLIMEVKFEIHQGEKKIAHAEGTINAVMEQLRK